MLEGELNAISEAWQFQREAGIAEIPVSIDKYLHAAQAQCKVLNTLREDEAGQVVQIGDRIVVIVNGRHSPERRRFTILHELAHVRLKLPSRHQHSTSVADLLGYARRPREEILCDVFASECLLPNQFFRQDVLKSACSFDSIQALAERYEASLTATGSRFAAYSDEACAWILADQKRIRFVSISSSLRQTGFFVRTGIEIPRGSVLGRLASGGARNLTPEVVESFIWTSNPCRGIEEFAETSLLMSSLDQGVSLLVAETVERERESADREQDEDDGRLAPLDGVLQFPDRRRRR